MAENTVISDESSIEQNNTNDTEQQNVQLNENVVNENDKEEKKEDQSEEIIVTIGEEAPPPEEEQSPSWVNELRKNFRTIKREKAELEKKLEELQKPKVDELILGQKPTLEQFDYDSDKYEAELERWMDAKKKVSEKEAIRLVEEKKQQDAWQQKMNSYVEAKSKLAVKDFDDAEEIVAGMFSETQRGILLDGVKNPALVVYALGKNPKKAKELSSLNSPVEFAVALGELASQLKVSPRKSSPPPEESIVVGTGSLSSTVDSTLDRLRADAAKTGDYTKVLEYKRLKRIQNK